MRSCISILLLLLATTALALPAPMQVTCSKRRAPTGQIVDTNYIARTQDQQPLPRKGWDLYWQANGVYAMWHESKHGNFYFCTLDAKVCVYTGRHVFYYDGNGVN